MKLISVGMPDGEGTDILYGAALQNTLHPFWSWAEENHIQVSFTKHTTNDVAAYNIRLVVLAEFENADDAAFFKLSFGEKILTRLEMVSTNFTDVVFT